MRKKNAAKAKESRGVRNLPVKMVDAQKARAVKGGKPPKGDIFAGIGDIAGESCDDRHKDEIEVLSYGW